MPDKINERSVVGLGYALFKDYDKLVSIQLPNTIESIDTDVFVSCDSLKTVNIPTAVTEIPDDMFRDCISLEGITIPEGIDEIGNRAFMDCTKLKSIVLPDSLRIISGNAFMNCRSLTTVTIDVTDSNLYLIYGSAFENCISLSDISLPADMGGIYDNAFKNCKSLKTFKFPAIHTISSGVLEGCTSITSVTIDEGTSVISSYVFKGCKSLTELHIPKNIQTIGLEALLGLSSLTKITVSSDNKVFKEHEGVLYRYDKNYDVYYLEHYPSMKESTTYNVINNTHWIDNLAFINNKFLVTLNLPSCIDDIGEFVWPSGYPSLTTITVPDGNEHFETVDGILYNKEMTMLLYYPAGRTATSFTVPNTVVTIAYCSMQDCQYLENIVIPDSVKTIEVGALQGCKKLKTVTIGTGLKDVKGAAFNDSDAIESITMHIPEEGRFFKIDPDQMELWADPGIIKASNSTNPVRIEYTYWGLDEDYGVVYTVAPDTYIIEFDPNGGNGNMMPFFMEIGVPDDLPKNTFSRSCYEFREWNTMANGRGTPYQDQQQVVDLTTVVGGTVKLYAQWDLAEYEVTFDANGGFGEMGSQTLKCYLSTPLNENTYAYDSKTFAFWNTDPNGNGITYSDKEYIIEPINGGNDVTLYAQWVDNNMYSVIFVNHDGWPYQSEILQLGAVIEAPETDPTMSGGANYTYTFHEWTGYQPGMTVTGNHIFFPVFIMTPIAIDEPEDDSVEIGTTEDIVDIGNIIMDIEGMFDDGSIQIVDLGFGNGSIEIGSDAFASIGVSDTTAGIVEVPTSSVPDNMASKVGGRPVYDVFVGGIHEFGGDLTISFTYYLQAGESGDKLSVWHFDDNGNYVSEECTYDELTHTVTFTTDNLSYFAIMYDVDPDDGGFPVWAIVLIVVAVVAVAGGIGVFVFLKKKN